MRQLRNLTICTLIARDLEYKADLAEVLQVMSDFADFAIQTHVDTLMAEMVALHGTPWGERADMAQQLIVVAMGKLGGRELNVSSDIDLIFLYPESGDTRTSTEDQRSLSNHEFFTRLGKKLIGALSELTGDGFTFRVDMALRPNGASGPLVASLSMLEDYLIVQGREWERYAWVKARAVTGDTADIARLESIVHPFVYRRYLDFGSIDALRTLHAQIRADVTRQEARHPDRRYNVKLGRGGIREIEFVAQVHQLIRGGRDAGLRERSTRQTLRLLVTLRLLPASTADELLHAYTFLRNLEHRMQYLDDAQTHSLPNNETDRLTVAQMMGYESSATLLAELERQRNLVAAHFDAIFRDKDAEQAATTDDTSPAQIELALADVATPETMTGYLRDQGFQQPDGSARRLLTSWHSSRLQALPEQSQHRLLAIITTALPLIAALPQDQDATLGRLLDLLEAIARRAAYLALLHEYPQALQRVVRMMHASDWAARYLTRHPLLLDELLDDRTLNAAPDWPVFAEECRSQLQASAGDTERQMDVLRELHHAQQLRLLAKDLEGSMTVETLADHLSRLADILVGATIDAAWQTVRGRHRPVPLFAVVAYGKLGGKELGYASDLDLIFLYDDPNPEAPQLYARLAQRFITWMTSHTSAGILFDVDIALRPDGASGLLVSSFAAFEKYQTESAWVWEHQALTRSRFCAGDEEIGERFEQLRTQLLRQQRDPVKLQQEVVTMRRKMHEAHPNRSALFDLKHDSGGMTDIEFCVQYLVLHHACNFAELTPDIGNIALLRLCGSLGLIDANLANEVADIYRNFRRQQHQLRMQGKDRARVEMEQAQTARDAVRRLWDSLFAEETAS